MQYACQIPDRFSLVFFCAAIYKYYGVLNKFELPAASFRFPVLSAIPRPLKFIILNPEFP